MHECDHCSLVWIQPLWYHCIHVIHVSIVGEKNGAVFDRSQQALSPKPEERKCWHLRAHRGREFQHCTKPLISTNPTDRPLCYRNTDGPFYVSNYNKCSFAWVRKYWCAQEISRDKNTVVQSPQQGAQPEYSHSVPTRGAQCSCSFISAGGVLCSV